MKLAFVIHQEEVITFWFHGDVQVFPQLNVPIGPQDESTSIAPGPQTVRI